MQSGLQQVQRTLPNTTLLQSHKSQDQLNTRPLNPQQCTNTPHQAPTSQSHSLTRREQLVAAATTLLAASTTSQAPAHAAATPTPPEAAPQASPATIAARAPNTIDPKIAACFTEAVYTAFADFKIVPEGKFQAQVFKLRQREYRYYADAVNSNLASGNVPGPSEGPLEGPADLPGPPSGAPSNSNPITSSKGAPGAPLGAPQGPTSAAALPLVPDLSDQGGLLNNALYFNFVLYILWKAALGYIQDPQQRQQLVMNAGRVLATLAVPDCLQRAKQAAAKGKGRSSTQELLDCLQSALECLQVSGYLQGYQVLWAATPGAGVLGNLTTSDAPASSATLQLLEPDAQGRLRPPAGTNPKQSQGVRLQVRLRGPADAPGVLALQQEEGGFTGALVGPLLQTIVAAAGYPASVVTETIQQDMWQGSDALGQKLFLSMVDPVYLNPLLQATPGSAGELAMVQDWVIM